MELIDIGVNLTNKSLLGDLDGVMSRAADAGVMQMVVTGTSLAESKAAIELCQRYPERLVSTCGVHPHHASDWNQASFIALKTITQQHSCVRAIGETGLDFNRNYSPRAEQEYAFEQQMALAAELGLPLFCHQRDAHARFAEMLREYRAAISRVVVHCFTDSREALVEYLDLDCHIGVTGWICDERRGLELRELVKLIPADRLMLETDAPYLLPRDLQPKPKDRRNVPANLPHILEAVAAAVGKPASQLADETTATAKAFFNLPQ